MTLKRMMDRRSFLKAIGAAIAALWLERKVPSEVFAQAETTAGRPKSAIKGDFDLVAAKGEDPYKLTVKAVEAMGGMGRFVRKGSTVVVKPNIGWDRSPEQAANTNPEVVGALVDLAFSAGAKRVNVFDNTCNDPRRTYDNSGIKKAAESRGANVYYFDDWNTLKAAFPFKSLMEGWPIHRDAIECDTFINVPILKQHSIAGLTISMKNLMGICSGDRGLIHRDIAQKLVDLTQLINPDLTIVDAYRVLLRHGPTGGSPADVKDLKTVVAATDPVLADAYGATLMGIDPMTIPTIKNAIDRGFGSADTKAARIHLITL